MAWVACLAASACVAPGPNGDPDPSVVDEGIAAAGVGHPDPCDWPQAFGAADHGGRPCAEQRGLSVVAQFILDPDADQESSDNGFLQIHYGSPLTSGDFFVRPVKRGYAGNGIAADGSVGPRPAETWGIAVGRWSTGVLDPGAQAETLWTADTAWLPIDSVIGSFGSYTNGYVQEFGLAIANGSVYALGARGTLERRALKTGALQSIVDPLLGTPFAGDARTLAVSPPSVDAGGSLYYAITSFPATGGRGAQPRGSWLAIVRPDDTSRLIPWAQIASSAVGVPQATDLCAYAFGTLGTPGPTGPDSQPPQFGCGTQRPAFNVPPTITPAGEIVVLSAANNQIGAEFVVVIDPSTMRPTAAYDTRGHMLTGCGVRLDVATFPGCAEITAGGTTHLGFDPSFNAPTSFTGSDIMNDAVVAVPSGDLLVTGYDGGFSFGGDYDARGGGLAFRRSLGGAIFVNGDFGWEVTPGVLSHALVDGLPSFTYVQDRNLYSLGVLGTAEYGPDESLRDHAEPPIDPSATAIDFLDNQVGFDAQGDRYGIDGSGHFYKFSAAGALLESVTLLAADGTGPRSIETESNHIARDRLGRFYVVYGGQLYVIAGGQVGPAGPPTGLTPDASRRLAAQRQAKARAAANAPRAIPPL